MVRVLCCRNIVSALLLSALLVLSTASYAAAAGVKSSGSQVAAAHEANPYNQGRHDGRQACNNGKSMSQAPSDQGQVYKNGFTAGFTGAGCSFTAAAAPSTGAPTVSGYQQGYNDGIHDGQAQCNSGQLLATISRSNPAVVGYDSGYKDGLAVGFKNCAKPSTTSFYGQGQADGIADGKLECSLGDKVSTVRRSDSTKQGYDAGYAAGLPIGFHFTGQC